MINFTSIRVQQEIYLRTLLESDVSERYVDWLTPSAGNRFIASASCLWSLNSLRNFVAECLLDPKTLLLGIFIAKSGLHVGNVKLVEKANGCVEVGILIGEEAYRGKGVGRAALTCISGLCSEFGYTALELCVDSRNKAACRLYVSCGFHEKEVRGFRIKMTKVLT